MPVYTYQCGKCGQVFTKERKLVDRKRRAKCQNCGSMTPELTISACSFALIGGGWAASGYSTGGAKKETVTVPAGVTQW